MFRSNKYKPLTGNEMSTIVQNLGLAFGVGTAVQQVLNQVCAPAKLPARVVGNGFDLGVRWAVRYPRLAEDFIATTDRMYEAQGVDRDAVVMAITRGIWECLASSGIFDTPGGQELRKELADKIDDHGG